MVYCNSGKVCEGTELGLSMGLTSVKKDIYDMGIVAAMSSEVSLVIDRLSGLEEEENQGIKFYSGIMKPVRISKQSVNMSSSYKRVVVGLSGPGKVNAALCTYIMLTHFNPKFIFNYGVVGAIASGIDVFDVVVANRVVQADIDTTAVGDPVGLVSRLNVVHFNSDSVLTSVVKDLVSNLPSLDDANIERRLELRNSSGVFNIFNGQKVYVDASSDSLVDDRPLKVLDYKKPGNLFFGDVATTDSFVTSDSKKTEILNNFPDTLVCDMELGAIAQTCYAFNMPFVSVKLISDNANSSANVSYEEVLKYASSIGLFIVESLLFNADFVDLLKIENSGCINIKH